MTGAEFKALAERRWGEDWLIAAASAFGVCTRTIRRWTTDRALAPRVAAHARGVFNA